MSKSFAIAAVLIFLGALTSLTFRLASSSHFGPTTMAMSFSRSSSLNTSTEYRFNNHGKIIGLPRGIYDREIFWAEIANIVQALFWIPALVIFIRLYQKRTPLSRPWFALLILGILIWLASEGTSFWT